MMPLPQEMGRTTLSKLKCGPTWLLLPAGLRISEEGLSPLPEAPIGDPQFTGHLLEAVVAVQIEFNGSAFELLIIFFVGSWHV